MRETTFFLPDWGMLRRAIDAFRFFFETRTALEQLTVPLEGHVEKRWLLKTKTGFRRTTPGPGCARAPTADLRGRYRAVLVPYPRRREHGGEGRDY